MKLVRVVFGVAVIGLLGACGASKGDQGAAGADGTSCTVTANDDGTATIACAEGTTVTVANGVKGDKGDPGDPGDPGEPGEPGDKGDKGDDGLDGASCTIVDNLDGTKTITCGDTTVQVFDGADGDDGADGASCTVVDDGQGTKTITCGDDSVTVTDGAKGADGDDGDDGVDGDDGASCTIVDNLDGTKTITCGATSVTVKDGAKGDKGDDGADGDDGTSCTVVDNTNGTKTITCGATSVTVNDGADGADGDDGTSCTVVDNLDGTKTITCGVTTVVVNDGAKGEKGDSCTVTDNGNGVKTVTCEDGTEATLNDGDDGVGCTVVDNGDGTKTITCASGSVTVADGATGPSAAYVVNIAAEIPASLTASITSITIASPPVVKFTVKDNFGRGVVGLKAGSTGGNLRFSLAKLVAANADTGEPADWDSYTRSSSGSPSYDRTGPLVDYGTGAYQYTFAADVTTVAAAPWDPNATTRLAIQFTGSTAAGAVPYLNATTDFIPATGAAPDAANNHVVVTTAACNECHDQITVHGSRVEAKYCVMCHNPDLGDEADMAHMTHAIHAAHKRHADGAPEYELGGHAYGEVTYPQALNHCKKCHDGATSAQGDNWKNFPTKEACGACHATVDFANHPGAGDVQADNANCKLCHNATKIGKYHASENATANATQVVAGTYNFTYEIKDVTVDGSNHPIIVFKIGCTKDGVVCNTAALPIDLATLPGDVTGGPSFLLTHMSNPGDPLVTSGDYDNLGYTLSGTANTNTQPLSVSLANLRDGTKGTLSAPDANGYYTATLSGTNAFPAGSVMRTVVLQGYFSQKDVTTKDWTSPPTVVASLGRHTVSVLKTVTGDAGRRTVVDSAKCGNCHEWFEGHGGNRVYTADMCAACHVPALTSSGRQADPATVQARLLTAGGTQWDLDRDGVCDLDADVALSEDKNVDGLCDVRDAMVARGYDPANPLTFPEESQNLKDLIHGIHGAAARGETTFDFVRDRGTSGVFYYDFSEITYPQYQLSNCLACHKTGTFDPELVETAADSAQMVAGASYPADTRTEILAARRTTPNASDFVSTPITATCSGCHTSELAVIHMEQNGGVYGMRRDSITETETCTICHGVGRQADVTMTHPGL